MLDVVLHDARIRSLTLDVVLREVRIDFLHLPIMRGGNDEECEYWSYAGEMVVTDVTSSQVSLRSDEGWVVDSTIEDESGVAIDETLLQEARPVKRIVLGFADGSSAVFEAGRAVINVGAPIEFIQIERMLRKSQDAVEPK